MGAKTKLKKVAAVFCHVNRHEEFRRRRLTRQLSPSSYKNQPAWSNYVTNNICIINNVRTRTTKHKERLQCRGTAAPSQRRYVIQRQRAGCSSWSSRALGPALRLHIIPVMGACPPNSIPNASHSPPPPLRHHVLPPARRRHHSAVEQRNNRHHASLPTSPLSSITG